MRKTLVTAGLFTMIASNAMAACPVAALCGKISSLQDINFGLWAGIGSFQQSYDACAFVQNDNENNYTITATGDGAANALELTNGDDTLPVEVEYRRTSAPGWTGLAVSVPTVFDSPNTTDENCAGGSGTSSEVRVTIRDTDLQAVSAGVYSGRVNLALSPD